MVPQLTENPEFHPPIEEYLEAILTLQEDGINVIQARIAECVGRSAPSVSEMLTRLEQDGYICRNGRQITLSDSGYNIALRVVRKHRLAERLLVDIIGLEWHKAHLEAGRWEHVISDEVEEKLISILGNPATCPHGNPIPEINAGSQHSKSQLPSQKPLSTCSTGDYVTLTRVTEQVEIDMMALELLANNDFITNSKATVEKVGKDGDVELSIGSNSFVIPSKIADRIYVTSV